MKRILLALSLLLFLASPAFAWTETYTWTADPNATSYKVEKSLDSGTTWTSVGTPSTPTFSYTGTDTGTVLFRVSNCNATGCTTRYWGGFWHNEAWRPAGQPTGLTMP